MHSSIAFLPCYLSAASSASRLSLTTMVDRLSMSCAGRNSQGQLGVGPSVETVTEPQVLQVQRPLQGSKPTSWRCLSELH